MCWQDATSQYHVSDGNFEEEAITKNERMEVGTNMGRIGEAGDQNLEERRAGIGMRAGLGNEGRIGGRCQGLALSW